MQEVTSVEVIKWLKSEIARQQERLAGVADKQKEIGRQIAEQQEKKKTLETRLAKVKADLAIARTNAKAAQDARDAEWKKAHDTVTEKQAIHDATRKDKTELDNQLEASRLQAAPILQKVDTLKKEIEQLRETLDSKKRLVVESTELPKEIERLRGRLARALALKAVYLQKAVFAEELLNENDSLRKSSGTGKLYEYKQLCKNLRPMVFDGQGDMP